MDIGEKQWTELAHSGERWMVVNGGVLRWLRSGRR